MADPAASRIFVNDFLIPESVGQPLITAIHDSVAQSASIDPSNTMVLTPVAEISFSDVIGAGTVTTTAIEAAVTPLDVPGQFSLDGALAYDITTTASVNGPINLCFNASNVADPLVFSTLRVLHGENGVWVDRTTTRDFSTGTICAVTSSLSPFAVARLNVHYAVKSLYDSTRAVRSGATFPLKLQLLGPAGTNLSSADIQVNAVNIKRVADASSWAIVDPGKANPDNNFRFDSALEGGGYIFNLSTAGMGSGTYILNFTATGDETPHTLTFQVR